MTTDNPDWRAYANCATTDPELFFPRKGGSAQAARLTCSMCPVQDECLTDALLDSEQQGVRAGTTERERRRMMHDVAGEEDMKGAA